MVAASQKVKSTDSNGRGGRSSGDGDDNKNDTVGRFANAERGMELMLDCVREEKVQVERAMADLQSANDKLDQSLVSRLQKGGLPKQASFVGFLLFAVRSLSDSVTLLVSGDESYLAAALIQGIVAFVCAAVFFLI